MQSVSPRFQTVTLDRMDRRCGATSTDVDQELCFNPRNVQRRPRGLTAGRSRNLMVDSVIQGRD